MWPFYIMTAKNLAMHSEVKWEVQWNLSLTKPEGIKIIFIAGVYIFDTDTKVWI